MLHIPSFLWAFYRLHFKYLLESCNKIRTHQVSAVSGGGVYAKLSLAFSIQIVRFFFDPFVIKCRCRCGRQRGLFITRITSDSRKSEIAGWLWLRPLYYVT